MTPLDARFVDCFVAFVNDLSADARAAENRFRAHPYAARLGFFKGDKGAKDYRSLQRSYQGKLSDLLRKGLRDAGRKNLADALNRLQFDGHLLVETLQGDKKAVPVKIGAMVDYVVKRRRVVPEV